MPDLSQGLEVLCLRPQGTYFSPDQIQPFSTQFGVFSPLTCYAVPGLNMVFGREEDYMVFLKEYLEASEKNPVIGLKDNLINILLKEADAVLFGGCAGHGCGAAFNFLSVLPDGDVHACRKFPSPVGNVYHQSIAEIDESEMAERYRSGSTQCRSCSIRLVCGGCLAVSYSSGLDIFEERDPFCLMGQHVAVSKQIV
jgi:radical SAM protein with 4Fe4S-binding SPASM domain